ncbi:MerR family transcriptional regulator [Saccharothrix xinjiangensis]|uniref:MerR family transcriptional regulator n=1 Tax=Saccharothrix xinjiangensis TaxID=204798 RepID=A0ABV9YCX1_9PSEU
MEQWSAGTVARMLGISPTTLRTWDRRYGLGPDTREEGRHRRYSPADVSRLRRMLELTAQGMAPAAAAAVALGSPPPATSRAGGGPKAIAVDGSVEGRGFARAAARLDAPLMTALTLELVERRGVVDAWESVLAPFLAALGERVMTRGRGVEVEHLATACLLDALRVTEPAAPDGRLPVLLACAPEEQHSLPLDVLAAALAERGCASRNLGARVPAESLLDAAALLSPGSVVLWAHARVHAEAAPVADLLSRGHVVLVGGPGWEEAPVGARRLWTLSEAVEAVLELNRS